MKLFWLLMRSSRRTMLLAILAGIASGASGAGLIALINAVLNRRDAGASPWLIWGFLLLLVATPLTRLSSDYLLLCLSQETVRAMRMKLSERILATPLRQLEEVGSHRLLVALTDDISAVTLALGDLPVVFVNFSMLVGCLVYLGWLSPILLLGFLVALSLGVAVYRLLMRRGVERTAKAREEQDELFSHFRSLTDGIQELKLHNLRRRAFLGLLDSTSRLLLRLHVSARMAFHIGGNWGGTLLFLLVGLLLFLLPSVQPLSTQETIGFVLVVLYVRVPIQVLLNSMPMFARGGVALRKIDRLGLSLQSDAPEIQPADTPATSPGWNCLELRGVLHTYRREGDERDFTLGPLDVAFHPAEIVFLAGGNGSGKTTFAKLFTGLYMPQGGEVRLDGVPVRAENLDWYRGHFAAVLSEFLFDRLLGLEAPQLDAQAERYLAELKLDHKVTVREGKLSTIALSRGQRKRLALLTAYLEDRPIYVFDEWAADQDPQFKEVFYLEILPELKRRGKAVLVISHDDRYFGVADRLLKLEDGQLVAGHGSSGHELPDAQPAPLRSATRT